MEPNIHLYINHHLGGSTAALEMLAHLANSATETADREFYHDLHGEIQKDQDILKGLLQRIEGEEKKSAEVAGDVVEKVSRLKFSEERLREEHLELLEALEILALGITGKKLLWQAFAAVSASFPAWHEVDFGVLEKRAEEQCALVNQRRLKVAKLTLP